MLQVHMLGSNSPVHSIEYSTILVPQTPKKTLSHLKYYYKLIYLSLSILFYFCYYLSLLRTNISICETILI